MGKAQAHRRRVAVLSKSADATEAKTQTALQALEKVSAQLQKMQKMLNSANKCVCMCVCVCVCKCVCARSAFAHALDSHDFHRPYFSCRFHCCFVEPCRYNARVVAETKKLESLEGASQHQGDLNKLRELVSMNEGLKAQESAFRASCKRQLMQLAVRVWGSGRMRCVAGDTALVWFLCFCFCFFSFFWFSCAGIRVFAQRHAHASVQATLESLGSSTNEEEDARLREIEDMFDDVRSLQAPAHVWRRCLRHVDALCVSSPGVFQVRQIPSLPQQQEPGDRTRVTRD